MASQELSKLQSDKERIISKLREAQKAIAEAYAEAPLHEIEDVAILLCKAIFYIEEDL